MQNGATLECPKCHNLLTCFIGDRTKCECGQVIQLELQMAASDRRAPDTFSSHSSRSVASKSRKGRSSEERIMNTGRWTKEEHEAFVQGLKLYGREWKKVANLIPSRTVVQIRTHAQKYFQKLAKEQGTDAVTGDGAATVSMATVGEDEKRRQRPKKSRQAPSSSGSARSSKKHRPLSYTGRSEHAIASAVPSSMRAQGGGGAQGQPPTPRTMRAAVTLVDQRTTARLQAGKNTPRTRAAAEWLAGLHAEGRYSWSAAAAGAPGVPVAKPAPPPTAAPANAGAAATAMPVHPAHPAPYHPQYHPGQQHASRTVGPGVQRMSTAAAPRMGLLAGPGRSSVGAHAWRTGGVAPARAAPVGAGGGLRVSAAGGRNGSRPGPPPAAGRPVVGNNNGARAGTAQAAAPARRPAATGGAAAAPTAVAAKSKPAAVTAAASSGTSTKVGPALTTAARPTQAAARPVAPAAPKAAAVLNPPAPVRATRPAAAVVPPQPASTGPSSGPAKQAAL